MSLLVVGEHIGGPGRWARIAAALGAAAVGVATGLCLTGLWEMVRL